MDDITKFESVNNVLHENSGLSEDVQRMNSFSWLSNRDTIRYVYNEIIWYLTSEGTYALPILLLIFVLLPSIALYFYFAF